MFNRIPIPVGDSRASMGQWFSEMSDNGLIFHPEDAAESIVYRESGEPFFSAAEACRAQAILDGFSRRFGEEAVIDACYPHFMRAVRRIQGLERLGMDSDG